MSFRVLYSVPLLIGCAMASLTSSAHHASATYDTERPLMLTGTVQKFRWVNPHTVLYLEVPDADGKVQVWTLEGPATLRMGRNGWKSTSLEPGERVQVLIAQSKSGTLSGLFVRVIRADGTVLDTGRIK